MENCAFENEVCNIGNVERVWRIIAGAMLIVVTFFIPDILGFAALLPLIAIYPIMTAVLGWDPIYQLRGVNHHHFNASDYRKFAKRQILRRERRPSSGLFKPMNQALS